MTRRRWWLVIDPTGNARGVRGSHEEAETFIRLRDLGKRYTAVEYVPADQLTLAEHERDTFARALKLAVASPELREVYVRQAEDSIARERERKRA